MTKTTTKTRTKAKSTPYKVSEHLCTPEEMAAYLDAWLEEEPDDTAGIRPAYGRRYQGIGKLRARQRNDSSTKRCRLEPRESLPCTKREGNPGLATVLKVAKALGMKHYAAAALNATRQRHDTELSVHEPIGKVLDFVEVDSVA